MNSCYKLHKSKLSNTFLCLVVDSCKWCCRDTSRRGINASACEPVIQGTLLQGLKPLLLGDGMPCVQGYCEKVLKHKLVVTTFTCT